jgi:hypothetical protein
LDRRGTVAHAAEGRLRRRNFHDIVILASVRHNRVPLQAATPVDVSVIIIITTSELLLIPEELLARICECRPLRCPNDRRDRLKILLWESSGYWLFARRIENPPQNDQRPAKLTHTT